MVIGVMEIDIRIPWVRSLKEKRSEVRRVTERAKNKFNLSIAEVTHQDVHGLIGLGVAVVSTDAAHADSMMDSIIPALQSWTEGELIVVSRELL